MEKNGIQRLDYLKLSETKEGLAFWEDCISQIVAIASSYPKVFNSEAAGQAIRQDAQKSRCYVIFDKRQQVASFCIATTQYYEAELIWGATRPDAQINGLAAGYFDRLARHVEDELFDEAKCPDFKIIIKVAAHDATIPGIQAHEKETRRILKYHQRRGYVYQYKLGDYFTSNNHVIVLVKRKHKGPYGYFEAPDSAGALTLPLKESREHEQINTLIQKDIRTYLVSFHEELTGLHKPLDGSVVHASRMEGFLGIAFVSGGTGTATMFSSTTRDPDNLDQFKSIFEYAVNASSLTRIITDKTLPPVGVVRYPGSLDTGSEIKVQEAFETFLKNDTSSTGEYALFYSRSEPSADGSCTILYFVSPLRTNIVVPKQNWMTFSRSAFAALFGINELLSALLETEYVDNPYLQTLIHTIPPVPYGIIRLSRKRNKRWAKAGGKISELSIAHEIDTPISVLQEEYNELSDTGKLAVDYLEMWRRFAKRDFEGQLPASVANMFQDNDCFCRGVYRLAHYRTIRRAMAPLDPLTDQEIPIDLLLQHAARWVEIDIDLPRELCCGKNEPWVRFAQTWLLFFAIGAAHHTIAYSFENYDEIESWEDPRIRRSLFKIEYERKDGELVIRVIDRGSSVSAPPSMFHSSLMETVATPRTIERTSNSFSRLPCLETKGAPCVYLEKARLIQDEGSGETLWGASIRVKLA